MRGERRTAWCPTCRARGRPSKRPPPSSRTTAGRGSSGSEFRHGRASAAPTHHGMAAAASDPCATGLAHNPGVPDRRRPNAASPEPRDGGTAAQHVISYSPPHPTQPGGVMAGKKKATGRKRTMKRAATGGRKTPSKAARPAAKPVAPAPNPWKTFADRFEREAATTLKVLRAFPADQGAFQPHPRSSNAHRLFATVAVEQAMTLAAIKGTLQMPPQVPPPPPTLADCIAAFEKAAA